MSFKSLVVLFIQNIIKISEFIHILNTDSSCMEHNIEAICKRKQWFGRIFKFWVKIKNRFFDLL